MWGGSGRSPPNIRISSSSCKSCFFCYKRRGEEEEEGASQKEVVGLCNRFFLLFQRHLQIGRGEEGGVVALPCEDCVILLGSFCELYEQLKVLELRVDWNVSKLERIMRAADRIPARVEYFRDCVLSGLAGVMGGADDDTTGGILEGFKMTRRRIIGKCKDRRMRSIPKVVLQQYNSHPKGATTTAKTEQSPSEISANNDESLLLPSTQTPQTELINGQGSSLSSSSSSNDIFPSFESNIKTETNPVVVAVVHVKEAIEADIFSAEELGPSSSSSSSSSCSYQDFVIGGSDSEDDTTKNVVIMDAESKTLPQLPNLLEKGDREIGGGDATIYSHCGSSIPCANGDDIDMSSEVVVESPTNPSYEIILTPASVTPSQIISCERDGATAATSQLIDDGTRREEETKEEGIGVNNNETRAGLAEEEEPSSPPTTATATPIPPSTSSFRVIVNPDGVDSGGGEGDSSGEERDSSDDAYDEEEEQEAAEYASGGDSMDEEDPRTGPSCYYYYNCELCPKSERRRTRRYKHLRLLRQHLQLDHGISISTSSAPSSSSSEPPQPNYYTKKVMSGKELEKAIQDNKANIRNNNNNKKKLGSKRKTCGKCGMTFSHKSGLKVHSLAHSGPKTWKHSCVFCGRKCITGVKLARHMQVHTREKPLFCPICRSEQSQWNTLRTHLKRAHTVPSNLCICNLEPTQGDDDDDDDNEADLDNPHKKNCKWRAGSQEAPRGFRLEGASLLEHFYTCDICSSTSSAPAAQPQPTLRYENSTQVRRHLKQAHGIFRAEANATRPYTKVVMSEAEIQKLGLTYPPPVASLWKKVEDYEILKCPKAGCGAKFLHPKALQSHWRSCHVTRTFRCSMCFTLTAEETESSSAAKIALHELEHHRFDEPSKMWREWDYYDCRRCGFRGSSRAGYLRHHLTSHCQLSTVMGICPVCELEFHGTFDDEPNCRNAFEQTLEHMRSCHDVSGMSFEQIKMCGESECPAYFKLGSQRRLHMKMRHSGERKPVAEEVDSTWNDDETAPSGGCPICRAELSTRKSLQSHLQMTHGASSNACICNMEETDEEEGGNGNINVQEIPHKKKCCKWLNELQELKLQGLHPLGHYYYYHCLLCLSREESFKFRLRKYKYLEHVRAHLEQDHGVAPTELNPREHYIKLLISDKEIQEIEESYAPPLVSSSKKIEDYKIMECRTGGPAAASCSARFLHPIPLQNHLKYHGSFTCGLCPKVETSPEDIALHELEHHDDDAHGDRDKEDALILGPGRINYNCRRCDFSASYKAGYLRHHFQQHLQLSTVLGLCPVCKEEFHYASPGCRDTFEATRRHMRRLHDVSRMNPRYIKRCSQCLAYFKTGQQLALHKSQMHPKLFKCGICREPFTSEALLRVHRRKSHEEKKKSSSFRCELCGKRLSQLGYLKRHLLQVHSGTGLHRRSLSYPFSCVFCGGKLKTEAYLEDHLRVHTGEKPEICRICGREHSGRFELRCHLDKEHRVSSNLDITATATPEIGDTTGPGPPVPIYECFAQLPIFICPVSKCKEKFLTPVSLEDHSKHHGSFSCTLCPVTEELAAQLALHELQHSAEAPPPPRVSEKGSSKEQQFACVRCDFTGQSKSDYLRHHSELHLGLPRVEWKCPICDVPIGALYTSSSDFTTKMIIVRSHFQRAHDLSGVKSSPSCIQWCDQCPAYFRNLSHLDRHRRRVHSAPFAFKCEDCDTIWRSRARLRTHRRHKHLKPEEIPFRCSAAEDCGLLFETLEELESHQARVHKPDNNLKVPCETCGKMFWKSTIFAHMVVHREKRRNKPPKAVTSKVFVCDQCGESFGSKLCLAQHGFSHSGPSSWKYTCPICGRKCFGASSLEGHIRTHTGEKPFICTVCGEAYAHRHNLRNHVNRQHSDVMEDKARAVTRKILSSKKGVKVKHVFDKSVKL